MKNASCRRNHSSDDNLITEWDPLPSLNLTNAEPDIVYVVQWKNITCGQNVSMGEETIAETSITSIINSSNILIFCCRPNKEGQSEKYPRGVGVTIGIGIAIAVGIALATVWCVKRNRENRPRVAAVQLQGNSTNDSDFTSDDEAIDVASKNA